MDPRGRFLQVMWTLPIISHSEEEAIASRTAYEASLRSLIDDLDGVADLGRFAEGIGIAQPFYLTYQGQNDRATTAALWLAGIADHGTSL